MPRLLPRALVAVLLSTTLLCLTHASDGPKCQRHPETVSIPNGGFETGHLAPWVLYQDPNFPGGQKASIYSPGHNSRYAARLDFARVYFPSAGYSGASGSICTNYTGATCFGSYYNVSFAWNWLHFDDYNTGLTCRFVNTAGRVFDTAAPSFLATFFPGWRTYSFVMRQELQDCSPYTDEICMYFGCDAPKNGGYSSSASLLVDDISVTLLRDYQEPAARPLPPYKCKPIKPTTTGSYYAPTP